MVDVGERLVVVTFKCSGKFKVEMDRFVEGGFDSRSGMIREAVRVLMGLRGFDVDG